jgi:hypothetical protein
MFSFWSKKHAAKPLLAAPALRPAAPIIRRPRPELDSTGRRFNGRDVSSGVICFLPWSTSFDLARRLGFVPESFAACYELPPAMASAAPDAIVASLGGLVADAERLLAKAVRTPVIIGYSLGTFPATYLANQLGLQLHAIASADRGDLMIWESPATRALRAMATELGYGREHFEETLKGLNPIENLAHLAPGSTFLFGDGDRYIPQERADALKDAIGQYPNLKSFTVAGGHLQTLFKGSRRVNSLLSRYPVNAFSMSGPSRAASQHPAPRMASPPQSAAAAAQALQPEAHQPRV